MRKKHLINQAIAYNARQQPSKVALQGDKTSNEVQGLTYDELQTAINHQVRAWRALCANKHPTMAVAVENHPAWVVLDLAALECQIPLVPLPFFFSSAQWLHAMQDAGASVLVTDHPELFEPLLTENITQSSQFTLAGKTLTQFEFNAKSAVNLPIGTAKITYTSGTTGSPKGVCLSVDNMLNVASAIAQATQLSAKVCI